jgi:hypothetical protein
LKVSDLLHVTLPWPFTNDLWLSHAVLLLVDCFAIQQLSGQLWRVFLMGVSKQVRADEFDNNVLFGIMLSLPWPSVCAVAGS